MKKQKFTKSVLRSLFLASLLTLGSVFSVTYLNSNSASAAPAGCYVRSGTSSSTVTIDEYSCPTEGYARAVGEGKCFVFSASSQGVATTGTETECSSINVGSNNVSTGNSGSGGSDGESSISTDCEVTGEEAAAGETLNAENCGIINLLVVAINFLSALAGLAIVASIMIAGYQYMTARDNAGQVQKAKQRIVWAIVALALFIFMYALLDFLVPGGVL